MNTAFFSSYFLSKMVNITPLKATSSHIAGLKLENKFIEVGGKIIVISNTYFPVRRERVKNDKKKSPAVSKPNNMFLDNG